MYKILDWKHSDDTRDIVHIVVQALVEGHNVALPAETGYHAVTSGLTSKSVGQFRELEKSKKIDQSVLLLRSAQELLDYSIDLSPVAARIATRAWPGPVVLDLPVGDSRSLIHKLPPDMASLVTKNGRAWFRVASHGSIQHSLRLMSGPLVAAPIQHNSRPVQQAQLAGDVSGACLVVDDGQLQSGDSATTIRVDGNVCQVVRPGELRGENLHRTSQLFILLVCTGNTCRSPMAEALMKAQFAKRFESQKPAVSPVFVASAGLSAFPGGPASPEAQQVMAARGLDLTKHQSYTVTEHVLRSADLILAMTRNHREALLDFMPEIKHKVHLVSGTSADVSDPFGSTEDVYSACADQIEIYVTGWVNRLDDNYFPIWSEPKA